MCHQSVGLIQSVIERAEIPTVSISMLREVTEKVRPPRVLLVDAPFGYPLVRAGDAAMQRRVMEAALGLLRKAPPISLAFEALN
jgi:D-proline reductase (dithiol) PrdB